MKKFLLTGLLWAFAGVSVYAQDVVNKANTVTHESWKGSGEFGFASARGNSRSETMNAKLGLSKENADWKYNFSLTGLRAKGEATVTDVNSGQPISKLSTTANRYAAEASAGYKLDARSYIVGGLRYDRDEFGANLWQGVASISYGYMAIKSARTELSFEIGPGFKRFRPADRIINETGQETHVKQDTKSELIGRGQINYRYWLTTNTALNDTFLVEAGSKNRFYRNEFGLTVSMTKKLALKLGYEWRYASNTQPGIKHADTLTTTNLVYNF